MRIAVTALIVMLGVPATAAPDPDLAPAPAPAPASFLPAWQAGLAAQRAGNFGAAIVHFERASAQRPDNIDVLVHLANSYRILGHFDEASTLFRQALVMTPDSADARLGIARVHAARGDFPGAQAAVNLVLARSPDNSEARSLQHRLMQPPARIARGQWRLDTGYEYSFYTRAVRAPSHESSAQIGYSTAAKSTFHARVEISRRFGKTDNYFQLGADMRPLNWLGGYLHAGATPSANFRPRWQVLTGGSIRVGDGGPGATLITLDTKWARHESGAVQTLTPGVRQYLAGGRISVAANWINTFDETGSHAGGWRARAEWTVTGGVRIFAGLSKAGETEDNKTVETRAQFGGLAFDIDNRFGARLDVVREDRQGSYIRNAVALSGFVRI